MYNVESFKAISNHFGSFLEVTISNSYGDYTGYGTARVPPGIIELSSSAAPQKLPAGVRPPHAANLFI